MKKLIALLLLAVGLASCSDTLDAEDKNEDNGGNDNQEYTVKFSVDIQFPSLGVVGVQFSDIYDKFYNDFIVSKRVIPQDYFLTFRKDGEIIGEYSGTWGETEIALQNGTYQVTGECIGDFDKASLSFDEEVLIDKKTTTINLTPEFKSELFLFAKGCFTNVWWCNGAIDPQITYFNETDQYFYLFKSTPTTSVIFLITDVVGCNKWHDPANADNISEHFGVTWIETEKNSPERTWVYPWTNHGVVCCDQYGHIASWSFFGMFLE